MQIGNEWRKSSKSDQLNNCVEVRRAPQIGDIEVRNSKRPADGSVYFTDAEWLAFTDGVKADEFEV
jgi:hypothetical protein